MRIPVVRFGDPTTTGGKVFALKAKIHDDGKKIALHGEKATCGNCPGTWPIVGTAKHMCNGGVPVVLQGDRVLCPCGKNRVIAGEDVSCFYHRREDEAHTITFDIAPYSSEHSASDADQFDEQFVLHGGDGRALIDTYYTLCLSDGSLIHGSTDASGHTARHPTRDARTIAVYLGHRRQ
ncbi:PAAR domain-containing protein [Paraburkholderia sp. J67]|uniref:PAAR domain-containing protein n=1 Tax=Paraburkholderia sp. J67 TaxID=2805435 RepID=UPI002ABE1754|nr:PAAR domain-containing protein [Paraburkholderia sp. J67]